MLPAGMRCAWVLLVMVGCAAEANLGVSLEHANLRVPYQTDPAMIAVYTSDIEQPYDVLGDLEITLRQQGGFGDMPTKDKAVEELRKQAGRIGAHAIVLLSFGDMGMSWWSYNEIRGHGRAIRFR
jgi:hypothetical protein